nr:MAG TPA: hypothetical protein [Caudoviricetes sp.]DAM21794.1 MAG TPA: hypothetical protein [Caudoviricetes sp.]
MKSLPDCLSTKILSLSTPASVNAIIYRSRF